MSRRETSRRKTSRAEPSAGSSSAGPSSVASSAPSSELAVVIRVSPASARTTVGGRRGDALVVRVTEAAVDGRATEAALAALARALGLRRRDVELRSGATSRDKIVTVTEPTPDVRARLSELMKTEASRLPAGRRPSRPGSRRVTDGDRAEEMDGAPGC